MLERFAHLGKALAFILAFIGAKLFLQAGPKTISPSIAEIPSLVSLAVIVVALTAAIGTSLRVPVPPPPRTATLAPQTPPTLPASAGRRSTARSGDVRSVHPSGRRRSGGCRPPMLPLVTALAATGAYVGDNISGSATGTALS